MDLIRAEIGLHWLQDILSLRTGKLIKSQTLLHPFCVPSSWLSIRNSSLDLDASIWETILLFGLDRNHEECRCYQTPKSQGFIDCGLIDGHNSNWDRYWRVLLSLIHLSVNPHQWYQVLMNNLGILWFEGGFISISSYDWRMREGMGFDVPTTST